MKYYFIVNPQSGKLNKKNLEENIKTCCLNREIPYKIFYTESAGDGTKIAKEIPDEECVIFSVGGDGSLNDVLNGMADSENKILGNIPLGSGNDFYKTMKKYENGIHAIDVGKINGKYFINVACLGLDADVANNIDAVRRKRWIPVSQRYNVSLIYTFFKYKYKKIKITMGHSTVNSECTILAVCNGQYYGGGFPIAPFSLINDGMFDVYLARRISKPRIIPILLKLVKGTHDTSPLVERYDDSKIIVDCQEEYTFNVDGEPLSGKHFELEIQKNRIKVLVDAQLIEQISETKK